MAIKLGGFSRGKSVSKVLFGRFIVAFVAFVLSTLASAEHARAQDNSGLDVDWLLSIFDTGFDPSPAGGVIEYIVEIDNNGFDTAPATTVDINIPADTIFEGTSGDLTNCSPASGAGPLTVTCDVPDLAPLEFVVQIVEVRTTLSASIMGSVTITGDIPDEIDIPGPNNNIVDVLPTNNDDDETTTINAGADIGLTLTLDATAVSGGTVDFQYVATNHGPDPSNGFTVDFPTPTGIVGMTGPAGCTESGGTWSCSVPGTVAVGSSVPLDFTGQISAASGSNVTAVASVLGADPTDPNAANNTANDSVAITEGTDVAIDKSRSPTGALLTGDTLSFTLATSYTGDAPSSLTITDTLPGNYTFDSFGATGDWVCDPVIGQDITCNWAGSGSAGANVSLGSIVVNVTATSPGSATNTATVAVNGSPVDQNPANNSDSDGTTTITDPVVDLRANKSGPSPALAVVGDTYSYSISTSNIGNADFFGTLEMVDSIPAGMTLTGTTLNGWTCTPGTPIAGAQDVTCTRVYTSGSPLAAGSTTPTVGMSFLITAAGTLTNQVSTSSPDANIPDLNPTNDGDDYPVESVIVGDEANITASKTAALATLQVGEVQTFTLDVVNAGPQPATNVRVLDTITNLISSGAGPTGHGLISVTPTAGLATGISCTTSASGSSARIVDCTIADLPVCSGADCPSFEIQVRPGGNAGARTNTFSAISSETPDGDLSDNTASDSFAVTARADVTVTKAVSPSPAVAGQNVTFVVVGRNTLNGLSSADDVIVTDTPPAGFRYVSASGSGATCTTTLNVGDVTTGVETISCDLGTIVNGGQRGASIVLQPTNALIGTTVTNNVAVTTTTVETDATNNTDSADVEILVPNTDILVNKIDSVDPLTIGETTVYTITVTNSGPSASQNVSMTDSLPTSLVSYQSHTVSGAGTCSVVPAVNDIGGTLTCGWPLLPAGDSETVTVTMLGVAKGTVDNNVSISSDEIVGGWDRLAANNQTDQDTTLRTRTDIDLVKTGPVGTVAVREDFNFFIDVNVGSGIGLAEADDVSVSDNLPTNMVLVGAPTAAVTVGSASVPSCTGAVGGTSFTCDLGTVNANSTVQITVPVEITAVDANPDSFTNSATVTTTSFDIDTTDNTDTAPVSVTSSSLAGTVFRDFADDAIQNGLDSGISGIGLTLTGLDIDGNPVSVTATTDVSGNYIFEYLPQSDAAGYTVTRGVVNEPYLEHGQNTAGSVGGTTPSDDVIADVILPATTDAVDYDFAEIPQARVGISKTLANPITTNSDGTFVVDFAMVVENHSLEPLTNIAVTDRLIGAHPLFGFPVNLINPATDPMPLAAYVVTTPVSGTCGGENAGFDGDADSTMASGFGLPIGGTCTLGFSIRVSLGQPIPTILNNQSVVTAEGLVSGQTSADNPQLTDLSDDGTNPDADNDGQSNEPGENDPTPVIPGHSPSIALVKTANTTAFDSPVAETNVITYNFAITNTGNVNLANVTLADTLPGIVISGDPIPLLAPGETDNTTFTATYAVTQIDIDAGHVTNTATTSGTDPFGTVVNDTSGTSQTNDDPLVTPLPAAPSINLVKTAIDTALQDPPQENDVISYTFAITNTGNVTLYNVLLSDILPGIVIDGAPIPSLAPGITDDTTFTATYAISLADIEAGVVNNTATTTGSPPIGSDVTDDDSASVPLTQAPSILLDKVADDSELIDGSVPGDILPFTFTVTNTGNMPLYNVDITDALVGVTMSGGPIPVLNPGEVDTDTFTATYVITLPDISAGEVINNATVTGEYGTPGGPTVSDDDTETAQVGNIEAIPEVFPPFTGDGGTTTSMLDSDLLNNDPATLATVAITVDRTDPGVTLDPTTALITLEPGYPAGVYTVDYTICSIAFPTLCDSTTETVVQSALPSIEVTKTQTFTDNGDGRDDIGDLVDYVITVENTGNVPLVNLTLTDVLTDLTNAGLTLDNGPDFVSASMSSPEGTLEIDEIATYSADFVLTLQAVNARGISNTVDAVADPVYPPGVPGTPTPVTDTSDDGIDTDGNLVDDPTELILAPSVSTNGLTLTKTTPREIVERGAVVPYTITIENTNPFVMGPVDIVDSLPAHFLYVPDTATLDGVDAVVETTGTTVTWPDVTVPAQGSITVTLMARILNGARSGNHTNNVTVVDSVIGTTVIGPATADVRILPEAVFDCSDVVGKVFEDHNGNGYQDAPDAVDRAAITDQTYHGGKGGKLAPFTEPRDENGIPGVRLVSPDGTVITTDENGLYSVPCAALPADRGSNFILKVDERTLPSGYRMTTENPRVMRLTPGMMAEMNFGAAIGRVVRVDLNNAAFAGDELSPQLVAGIQTMVAQLAGDPANIRLAYHLPNAADADAVRDARRDMRLVEDQIRREWQSTGRARLLIEQTIVRVGP